MKHLLGVWSLLVVLAAAAHAQPVQTLPVFQHVTVSVLVENMAGWNGELGEWGLSFLVDAGEHQIILDTGGGKTLSLNAGMMKVDLCRSEAIVISHGHGDHTLGLNDALNACKLPSLFVHPVAFQTRYWREDSGQVVATTMPVSREQLHPRVGKLVETKSPTLVCPGIMVTGQIPRVTDYEDTGIRHYAFMDSALTLPDQIEEDQALFFRVPEGIVILLGCGHSGVVNTIEYVCKLTGEKQIYAIMGGTHLVSASPQRIQKTIDALRNYGVQKIMLSHCTGVQAFAQLANAFPGKCSWPASGTVVAFGKK